MYDPQSSEKLDFEIGAFGDGLKKAFRKVKKGLDVVTDATIVKPSEMIGGMFGKKGKEWGRKLGKLTQGVTEFGVGAGAAGLAAPVLTDPTVLTGMAAKHFASKKKKHAKKAVQALLSGTTNKPRKHHHASKSKSCKADNALAARVAAMLAIKLGGPLSEANKMLHLAELQREATYEHKKLMSDSEFRQKVLAALAARASQGDQTCTKTIRVLMGP